MPRISQELIEYLEALYPDECPSLNTGERTVWFKAGQVDLVRHLRSIFTEQSTTVLEGD